MYLAHGTTRAQQDIMLLGAVTVLGASMNSHVRCAYGGKMISPSLQTFIVALPASGKGVLSLVRLLVAGLSPAGRSRTVSTCFVEASMRKRLSVLSPISQIISSQVHNYQLSVDAEPESGFLYFGNQPSAARHGAERGETILEWNRFYNGKQR